MRIGPYPIEPNVVLAPMAGVTDKPFRVLCKRLGAGYAVSEMVTSRRDLWNSLKTSRRANHLDVFLVATDGTLQHTMWKGNEWWRWEGLGGYLTEDPAAVAWNDKRLDVFGRGGDNAAYHCYWRDR